MSITTSYTSCNTVLEIQSFVRQTKTVDADLFLQLDVIM